MWVCTVGLIIYQCVLDGTGAGAGAGVQAFKLQASSFRRGRVGVFRYSEVTSWRSGLDWFDLDRDATRLT
jgi:hypothetical protein